jgi:hypothetical protein
MGIQNHINKGGLSWTFVKPNKQVGFIDFTIKIKGQKSQPTYLKNHLLCMYTSLLVIGTLQDIFGNLMSGTILGVYRLLCTYDKDVRY